MKYPIILLLLQLVSTALPAMGMHDTQEKTIELADGAELSIRIYPSTGQNLVLWLPSEFGLSPRQAATASAMTKLGMEVWLPDLHSAWFIPTGRYSLNDVDPGVIRQLIQIALATEKNLYLMASGRVNVLALHGIRRYQQGDGPTGKLGGLLGFNPRLFIRTPQGGEAARFLPIATATNLPVYLLQPEDSGGYWRTGKVIDMLSTGGSPVFAHTLHQVSDGFYLRDEYSPAEAQMTRRLPYILARAIHQLQPLGGAPADPAPMQGGEVAPEKASGAALLKPYLVHRQAPPLHLPVLQGGEIHLTELAGKVVIVNFWTTWCPPCVEEIPSLERLYAANKPLGLEILAVDVGETAEQMRAFLVDKPIHFPVLMDTDGKALKTWGIHAFPTSLVVDKQQRIRYAVFGAFDWSSAEVMGALKTLLNEE